MKLLVKVKLKVESVGVAGGVNQFSLAFLECKGKELCGEHFRLYGQYYSYLEKLLAYVSGESALRTCCLWLEAFARQIY